MGSVEKLFRAAVYGSTKDARREAFRELRRLSLYGEKEEMEEAAYALAHGEQYLRRLEAA